MTLEELQDMTEAEWNAMPLQWQYDMSKLILDSLCDDGLAYLGDDGRYRLREDVEVTYIGDDTVTAKRKGRLQ